MMKAFRIRTLTLVLAVAAIALSPCAGAQGWRGPHGPTMQGQPMKKGEPGGGREYRGGPERRPPARDERHQGRMSDEERRALHQDLDRANREIYKPPPRR